MREKKLTLDEFKNIKNRCHFLKENRSIMGHILAKPYGYAGDFHIIDRIYTNDISTQFPRWDDFSLANSAAQAVRNRKDYFKIKMSQVMRGNPLNIASVPARDLYELYNENTEIEIQATCVGIDMKVIDYADKMNIDYLNKINFINKNTFRFDIENKYDIIWSAGLFDYFDDRAFVMLIRKFKSWLNDNGEIIIGNFNADNNPHRAYMELVGDWYLTHRTEEQLYYIARQAGYEECRISIGHEPENVNLLLHIRK